MTQGGDGSLSTDGETFAQNLSSFIEALPPEERPSSVWISSLKRTGETAKYLRQIPKVGVLNRRELKDTQSS